MMRLLKLEVTYATHSENIDIRLLHGEILQRNETTLELDGVIIDFKGIVTILSSRDIDGKPTDKESII